MNSAKEKLARVGDLVPLIVVVAATLTVSVFFLLTRRWWAR